MAKAPPTVRQLMAFLWAENINAINSINATPIKLTILFPSFSYYYYLSSMQRLVTASFVEYEI
jgi:hypothetical protein